jgi:hypothetical protein
MPCRAAAVAEEAGERLGRALKELPADHVPVGFSCHRHILNSRPEGESGAPQLQTRLVDWHGRLSDIRRG